ncbi:MAG: DegV family protein [Clostridia bacterium]|nr:DegV family protein [Clostridia bacterium]
MFQLFTDTDTDILPEEAGFYGYKLISMPYAIKDGETVYPYEDFDVFESRMFYNSLRNGTLPTTYGLSPVKYIEYFEPTLKEGKDILYVHFSAAMSGTFDSMKLAWKELSEKYPDRKLYTVDTKAITICSNNIVKEIGEMALRGASVEEILAWAHTEVDKFAVYFFADDLKFFVRSGRVSGLSAVFGGILGIRPIININSDGIMGSVAKAKGRKGAINKILAYVDELQDNIKEHRVIVGHADAPELAAEVELRLKEKYGDDLRTEIVVVNPTAGSHCGPDTVGVCFHAKHR